MYLLYLLYCDILKYLDGPSIVSMYQTSKYFNNIDIRDNDVWKHIMISLQGSETICDGESYEEYKKYYLIKNNICYHCNKPLENYTIVLCKCLYSCLSNEYFYQKFHQSCIPKIQYGYNHQRAICPCCKKTKSLININARISV